MAADPLVGKVLADRFAILERIGEGGTGVVYKAKQLSVDRIIAIKVLGAHVSTDPSWVKRFHNEARAASRLDHPNTVRLIDFGQTKEGLLFIAMEFLHGKSLRDVIDQEGRLAVPRALRIVSQMCQSLSEAHSQGIIHRDIKPDNVHLEQRNNQDFVKVLDFSVAKLDAPDAMVTRAGVVFGTPSYMSPEQGRGVPLDRRSDVYACGIVLYEMLNGKPPFEDKVPTQVVMMHLRDKPAPLQNVPPQIAQIVMKALEKDPARRQQTADDLGNECEQALMEVAPRATPMSGVPMMGAPSHAAPQQPPPAGSELRTMMAQAPMLPNSNPLARTMAPPPSSGPPPGAGSEMRTMMAQAPSMGAPPPSAAPSGGNSELRTMMAQAPVLPSSAPPLVGPPSNEIKTMMAQAPQLPQRNAPPPGGGNEAKTMMAQAPILPSAPPPGGAPQQASAASNMRTVAAMAAPTPQPSGGGGGNPQATMMLPDSQGVVAYAADKAKAVRAEVSAETVPAASAGALFWLAWIVIGIGAGFGYHYFMVLRAAQ
jgi:serine/threonine-protein kinase